MHASDLGAPVCCACNPQVPQLVIFCVYINAMGLFTGESTQGDMLSLFTLLLSLLSLVYNLFEIYTGCRNWRANADQTAATPQAKDDEQRPTNVDRTFENPMYDEDASA